jgi:ABC-type multidrug transport system ATPase subunit
MELENNIIQNIDYALLADEGTATAGFDVVKEYKSIRNVVGYMPGKFSLYQDLTVEGKPKFCHNSLRLKKTTISSKTFIYR